MPRTSLHPSVPVRYAMLASHLHPARPRRVTTCPAGRVTLWTLSKSELDYSDLMTLRLVSPTGEPVEDDDSSLSGLAGGCCFDFSRLSEHLFLVGTEEGRIHKCSKVAAPRAVRRLPRTGPALETLHWPPRSAPRPRRTTRSTCRRTLAITWRSTPSAGTRLMCPPPSPTALPAETRHRVTPFPVAPGRRVSFSRAPLTGRSGCGITRGRRASSRSSSGIRRVGETLRRRLCHLHDRAATPRPPPAQVGDVAWTPWSSTTFAACTADGKVHLLAR